jgi:hypothetical protein
LVLVDRPAPQQRVNLKYRACPKCGHAPAAGAMLVDECPACGVLFRKMLAAPTPAQVQVEEPSEDWWTQLLETPEESRSVRTIAGGLLWLVAAWYAWQFFRFNVADPESMPAPFLYSAIVPFHEFGHILFSPFGEFMHIAGGSLMQFLMPLGFGIYFVRWRGDNLAGWLMLWWEGTQWVNLAPYCYDAKTPTMILLTGRTGDTGAHDYIDMLGDLGLLNRAHEVAAVMKYFGVLLMLAALVWGALLLIQSRRGRA